MSLPYRIPIYVRYFQKRNVNVVIYNPNTKRNVPVIIFIVGDNIILIAASSTGINC